MSRLEELIAELCPNGVEYKMLGDIGRVAMCKRILKNETSSENGVPFYKIGTFGKEADAYISYEKYIEYKSKYSFPQKGDILISAAGTIGRTVIYNGEDAYYQDSNIVWLEHDRSQVMNKYLFYCYQLKPWNVSSGGTIARLYNDNINKAKIPVPPLPIQEEIVRILDKFAELTAELTKRKQQYQYYTEHLFSDDTNAIVPLGDVADIGTGSSNTNEETEDGEYPFFVRSQEVRKKDTWEYDETAIITAGDGVGVGKVFHYVEGKYALHQRAYRINITDKNILPKYFFYYMKNTFFSYITRNAVHASVTSIRRRMLDNYPVPVPPLEEQERIVAILDRFDALCNDLTSGLPAEIEARKKQYEYYRDKLLTFKEAV